MLQFLISNWSLASAFCSEVFVVTQHCTKKSKYGVISGPYFPVFGLNTEIHGVNLRIQSECRKIRTKNNSVFGQFSRSAEIMLTAVASIRFYQI